ncbi:MAG: glycosyltransferase family 2 protein [Planctomycetes bacterium]|nr:glycosyltransferase family 2 protein [Planctomycetota bacterium]
MNSPISIVVPAYGDPELALRTLVALQLELNARGGIDEVVVVDDGGGELAARLAERFPKARCVARTTNGGFARALTNGIEVAKHALVRALNSDVLVRVGALAPLVEALEDPSVFAAVPRVLLGGDERRVESWVEFACEDGRVRFDQPSLTRRARAPRRDVDVAFPVGGACLFRKRDFAELGGFDPLFEPFYFEDADLGWRAWRAGKRTRLVVASSVEHRHRGTIGKVASERLVRAAIERNTWLFQWKHLAASDLAAHVAALEHEALDAWLSEDRERLEWLALALERAEAALAAPRPVESFASTLARLRAPE